MIQFNKSFMLKIGRALGTGNKMFFLAIAVCLIAPYLDFAFLMKLQLSGVKNLELKITRLKKDLSALEKDLLRMQELKNKQLEKKDKWLLGAKKIISEEYKASLLQDVSNLANKNGVRIMQMKPEKAPPSQKQERVSSPEKFTPLLITLDLFCDYHQMGAFINDLENAQILIAVQNIKIASQPKDFLRQKVSLVLRTYVKK